MNLWEEIAQARTHLKSAADNATPEQHHSKSVTRKHDQVDASALAELDRLIKRRPTAPHLDDQGGLRIPLNCDPKYRWWQGSQSPFTTALELGASDEEIENHVNEIFNSDDWRKWQKIKNAKK
jgi:hypothetical protein